MITFDSSLLTAYYNAKAGIVPSGDGSGVSGGGGSPLSQTNSPTGSATAPRAPWAVNSPMAQESDLVRQVLLGHRFINPSSVTSDVTGASADYNKLFSLYQGLSALEGLATKAQDAKTSANQMAEIRRRFAAGLTEVQSYVQDTKYDHLALTQGTLTQELKSSVGVPKTNATYTGPAIASGSATAPVKAFEGDVQFSVAVKKIGTATPYNIDFDLADMGSTPRTMANVVNYLNSKLKAEGLNTKFAVSRTPAQPTTTVVNGKTVTTSAGQDSYSLQIKGASYEALTFSAPKTADSVYVVQSTGDPNKKVTTTAKPTEADKTTPEKPIVTSQLIKFQTDTSGGTTITDPNTAPSDPISKVGNSYWVEGEAQQVKLPDTVAEVQDNGSLPKTINNALQTMAGPDGSVYVLANIDGTTANQDIKGNQDVALLKYDSAGKLVFTRTLGAANSASGLTMALSADGKVAIAGSVTGALDVSSTATQVYKDSTGKVLGTATTTVNQSVNGANASVSDSFVTVFDAAGVEQWTQRRGGAAADEATAVAFGADGSVYVGGRAQSTMPGASGAVGGWDGYVSGYSATGKFQFTNQIGTTGSDAVAGIVVDGSNVYTSSIESGDAVVRSFSVTSSPVTTTDPKTGLPVTTTKYTATQTAQRDLGGMGGGSISGMSVYNGKIYLGGSSGSDKLLSTTGTTTKGYSGGYDAFALEIDSNLSNTGTDKVAYYGGAGVEKGAEVQFSNGKAWISGQTTGDISGTTKIATKDAYLARLNIDTGTVEYQTRYSGADGMVQPSGIAVSQNSSSVLDKLGLPMGSIQYTDSNLVVSGTSVRTGDQFYMVDPDTGVRKTITIDANETLDTLAKKITRASSYKLKVDVTSMLGSTPMSRLDIKPANGSSKMEFVAGPAGRDALASLGIDAGIVSSTANQIMDTKAADYLKSQKQLGLNFDNSLTLGSPASVKDAIESLQKTMKNVQLAYNYLKYGDPQVSDTKSKGANAGGQPPAYLTNQINNLNAGLQRLLGSA